MSQALVIGSNGTIGSVIARQLEASHQVVTLSRDNTDYSASDLKNHYQAFKELGSFSIIICCIGVLHDEVVNPEKKLKDISADRLMHYYKINSVLPMLCMQQFRKLLDRKSSSVFACLSAMVGSISDNKLGGWYGYRSSKSALNMLVKNTAIEVRRSNKKASIIAIHPGTTVGALSKPFASNIDPNKYYTPEQSAQRIITVAKSVTPEQSGQFFNWDGQALDY